MSGPITLGHLSPPRSVPPHIPRPEYAETGEPAPRGRVSCVKSTPEAIERMRAAGRVAREVLEITLDAVKPGITTDALDAIAHEAAVARGAYPSPLNYRGFPKSICTSVNEVICHGIPDDRKLMRGDLVNCDITVYYQGMHGDCSETVFVGEPDAESLHLVRTTYDAMMAGIAVVKPGERFNSIGKTIARIAKDAGLGVVRAFAGHGIGELFHMPPSVAHHYERTLRLRMEPGMTFTIEPMLNLGGPDCHILADDWTAITADRRRSAQFEHTVLVTPTGVEILTGSARGPLFQTSQGY
ncbi:MAG: type I methionyl aminopeptidase [Myxococcales bacterium]|nr:type I methionyl aminopeptidase [Myxococcales bacterium]